MIEFTTATLGGQAMSKTNRMKYFNFLSYCGTNTNEIANFPEVYPQGTGAGVTVNTSEIITLRIPLVFLNPMFQLPYLFVSSTNNLEIVTQVTLGNLNYYFTESGGVEQFNTVTLSPNNTEETFSFESEGGERGTRSRSVPHGDRVLFRDPFIQNSCPGLHE